jgi:hypothetical protein
MTNVPSPPHNFRLPVADFQLEAPVITDCKLAIGKAKSPWSGSIANSIPEA